MYRNFPFCPQGLHQLSIAAASSPRIPWFTWAINSLSPGLPQTPEYMQKVPSSYPHQKSYDDTISWLQHVIPLDGFEYIGENIELRIQDFPIVGLPSRSL